jgi:hypothetical protein
MAWERDIVAVETTTTIRETLALTEVVIVRATDEESKQDEGYLLR